MTPLEELIIYLEEQARKNYKSAAESKNKKQRDEDQMRGDIFAGVLHKTRSLFYGV